MSHIPVPVRSLLTTHRLISLAIVLVLTWFTLSLLFIRNVTTGGCEEVRNYHAAEVGRYEEVLAGPLHPDVRLRLNYELSNLRSGPCW